jgi:hypothetical protein
MKACSPAKCKGWRDVGWPRRHARWPARCSRGNCARICEVTSVRLDPVQRDDIDRLAPLWLALHAHHQKIAPQLAPFRLRRDLLGQSPASISGHRVRRLVRAHRSGRRPRCWLRVVRQAADGLERHLRTACFAMGTRYARCRAGSAWPGHRLAAVVRNGRVYFAPGHMSQAGRRCSSEPFRGRALQGARIRADLADAHALPEADAGAGI